MGYTFIIGNAVPHFDRDDFPYLTAQWRVEKLTHPSAPEFLNDTLTGKSNSRSPSYSGWADFCRSVGLYDFFFDSGGHLKAGHPGCIGITEQDWQTVRDALDRRKETATLPPGFEPWDYDGAENYDYHLARLHAFFVTASTLFRKAAPRFRASGLPLSMLRSICQSRSFL